MRLDNRRVVVGKKENHESDLQREKVKTQLNNLFKQIVLSKCSSCNRDSSSKMLGIKQLLRGRKSGEAFRLIYEWQATDVVPLYKDRKIRVSGDGR